MRFQILAALSSLSLCFAASGGVYQELVNLASSNNGNIRLDEKTFDLLTAPNRNWSASVLFTALDSRRRCGPCKEFQPAWTAVTKAWSGVPTIERDTHFFGTIDFDDGQNIFQRISLTSAPVVFIYPPTEGPRQPANGKTSPLKYDMSHGFDAAYLAEQMSSHTPIPIPYNAPIDWARWGTMAFLALVVALGIRFTAPLLQNRWVWAAVTVVVSLIMTAGHMFNRIRSTPYTGGGGQWIAGGYSMQYGQETQIIALIYGLLGASFLMLTVIVPTQSSPARQKMQVYLWTVVILIMYSILISLFRVKNRGYPFRLIL